MRLEHCGAQAQWGNFPDVDGLAIKLKSEKIRAILICKI